MFALLFALARMASAAWVGAAVLFVIVAVDQTVYIKDSPDFFLEAPSGDAPELSGAVIDSASGGPAKLPVPGEVKTRLVAQFAERRFLFYYYAGAVLIGVAWCSTLFLKSRYLKPSRWLMVMLLLSGAAGLMAYDWVKVYGPLRTKNLQIMANPGIAEDGEFRTLHEHSRMVNSAQLLLTLMGSILLCLPGTRPEQPSLLIRQP